MTQKTDKPSPVSDGPVPSSADAAHTPGPWKAIYEPAHATDHVLDNGGYRIDADGVTQLAFVWVLNHRLPADGGAQLAGPLFGTVRASANARLIAAAPDMLAALDQLTAFVSIMIGQGPDATIPETVRTPLGVPVKVGKIMRAANEARARALGSKP